MLRETLSKAKNITQTIDRLNNALDNLECLALKTEETDKDQTYFIGWLDSDKKHMQTMIVDYVMKLEKELESL